MRILCLHGYGQSASFFRQRIGSLRKALGKQYSFVCPDGPHEATAAFLSGKDEERGAPRSWWRWEDADRASTSYSYSGVDDSLELLARCIEAEGPFDGILGFSQGATMAALMCLHPPLRFRFAILISGFVPRDPHYANLFESSPPPPLLRTLHVHGRADDRVPPAASERLARCFEASAQTAYAHPGGHAVPSDANFRALLKEFCAASAPPAVVGGGAGGGGRAGAAIGAGVAPQRGVKEGAHGHGDASTVEAARFARSYASWRQIRGDAP